MPIEYQYEVVEDPWRGCMCSEHLDMLTPDRRAEALAFQADEGPRAERRRREADRRARTRREEEQRRLSEQVACGTCSTEHERRDMLTVNGAEHCTSCASECAQCNEPNITAEMHTVRHGWMDAVLCSNCTRECMDCEEMFASGDMIHAGAGWYCRDCATYCDNCDRYFVGEDCSCDDSRVRGLSGYGKTRPMYWLGGPVPKDKKGFDLGYYIGFELEISASSGHVRPVHQWASEHLGYSDAVDCKEDSSVDGFEIATQPMTPQFFEGVNWESFFDVLNDKFPINERYGEPETHGLHVHIGRAAFAKDDIAMAAFCYLLGQGDHLVRVGRREPTDYCKKVEKPVSTAIKKANSETGKHYKQASKSSMRNIYPNRDAINLTNGSTIEIRAFRSTRKASDLRDSVRMVYVGAEYIRYLRGNGGNVSPRALHWGEFAKWVGVHYPFAFDSIAGITDKKAVKG